VSDTANCCQDCQTCQIAKVTNQLAALILSIPVLDRRFINVHVDQVGLLPVSTEGFRFFSLEVGGCSEVVSVDRLKHEQEHPSRDVTLHSQQPTESEQCVTRYKLSCIVTKHCASTVNPCVMRYFFQENKLIAALHALILCPHADD
jgi:hypothetical protein